MTSRLSITRQLLLYSGVGLLSLSHTGMAHALENTENENTATFADSSDDIVVEGIRASLDTALEIKRDAPTVVDAISAEDIGKYPDINIAESVQRISGVQINRSRGEGQTVNIRGLPAIFTLNTLNSRSIANALINSDATASRAFDFSILAPEFVNAIEVYKAPTADLEEGGLAGVVNVRTPRAFEIGRSVLTASAQAEHSEKSGKVGPRASFLYADTFADDRIGITLGGSYSERRPETHMMSQTYNYQTEGAGLASGTQPADFDGNGVIESGKGLSIPSNLNMALVDEKRERISAIGSIEFQASENLTIYAEGLYSRLDILADRSENNWIWSNSRGLLSSSAIVSDQHSVPIVTAMELSQLDLRANGRVEDRSGHLLTVSAGAIWEREVLRLKLSASHASSKQNASNMTLATNYYGHGYFRAEPGDAAPSVGFFGDSIANFADPAYYRIASVNGELNRKSRDRLNDIKLDVSYDTADEGLVRILGGIRYSDRSQYQGNQRISILPPGVAALAGGLPPGVLPGSYSAADVMRVVEAGRGAFLQGLQKSASFPGQFLVSDPEAFILAFSPEELIAGGNYHNDITGIVDVQEKAWAGYVRGDFEWGRFGGNVGLRVVRTDQASVGVRPDFSSIVLDRRGGSTTRIPAGTPITVKRSYTDFLPSLNLRYEPGDRLVLRFAASRTMARPNLEDIAPTTTANGLNLTITEKNPELDPFRSNNLDLSAEWYFAPGAMISVAGFYKNLRSLIQNQSTAMALPVQVINLDNSVSDTVLHFTSSRLVNGSGVKLKGVEIAYQQAFTFLPHPLDGLGLQANYTFIDNSRPHVLTAASRHNFNVIGYYEKGPLGVRLSYSWRGSYLSTAPEFPHMGITTEAFGTLDGGASVQLTEQVALSVDAVNILGTAMRTTYLAGLPNQYVDTGRRILVGARVKF